MDWFARDLRTGPAAAGARQGLQPDRRGHAGALPRRQHRALLGRAPRAAAAAAGARAGPDPADEQPVPGRGRRATARTRACPTTTTACARRPSSRSRRSSTPRTSASTRTAGPCASQVMNVTPSYLRVMRTAPALGRAFTNEEGEVGNEKKVLLSDGLWRSQFAGDPGGGRQGPPHRRPALHGRRRDAARLRGAGAGRQPVAAARVHAGGEVATTAATATTAGTSAG